MGIKLTRWFGSEAKRVYAMLSEDEKHREQRQLIEWIDRKGGSVTAREVQQGHRRYKTAQDAEAALEELAAGGLGHWESSERSVQSAVATASISRRWPWGGLHPGARRLAFSISMVPQVNRRLMRLQGTKRSVAFAVSNCPKRARSPSGLKGRRAKTIGTPPARKPANLQSTP